MENFVFTQLSIDEIKGLFRQELEHFFSANKHQETQPTTDALLTIQQVADILCLSIPTIYGLVSRNEIPCMKKGKRLYFSKIELINWVKSGRKKTVSEISAEADTYLQTKNKKNKI